MNRRPTISHLGWDTRVANALDDEGALLRENSDHAHDDSRDQIRGLWAVLALHDDCQAPALVLR
jgi:hypothetical protein